MRRHGLLGRLQQGMAPVERGLQGLVAIGHADLLAGQQLKALVEPLEHAAQAQQGHAGGRELDGQWQAVEALAKLHHLRHLHRQQLEVPINGVHLIDEQLDRPMGQGFAQARIGRGHGEGAEAEHALTHHLQRHLAGHQQAHAGRTGQDEQRPARPRR